MASKESVTELIASHAKSVFLRTACSMKLFDVVEDLSVNNEHDEGWVSLELLATTLCCHQDRLRRFLRTITAFGLLSQKDNSYRNTSTSRTYLLSAGEDSMLPRALARRELTSEDLLSALKADPQLYASDDFFTSNVEAYHLKAMSFFRPSYPLLEELLGKVNTSGVQTIVDLGGGYGHVGCMIQQKFPDKNVMVVDLPGVIEKGRLHAEKKGGNFGKLHFQAGDFFKGDLPKADCYVLSHILHDWAEDQQEVILQQVHSALTPGGQLVVLGKIVEAEGTGLWAANVIDMYLMSVNAPGFEMTEEQYRQLILRSGFSDITVHYSDGFSFTDQIVAKKH